jgi:hypothetical protein
MVLVDTVLLRVVMNPEPCYLRLSRKHKCHFAFHCTVNSITKKPAFSLKYNKLQKACQTLMRDIEELVISIMQGSEELVS